MIFSILRFVLRALAIIFVILIGLGIAGCTMLGMRSASLETAKKPAPSPALNVAGLEAGREALKQQFEEALYGPWPEGMDVVFSPWKIIAADYKQGRGTLEEAQITVGRGEGARTFHLVAAFPKSAQPVPLIVSQTFSSNCAVFEGEPVTDETGAVCKGNEMDGFVGRTVERVFGEFIATAPVDRYLDAGFAYASFFGPELVPDSRKQAPDVMAGLGGAVNPSSTLMAWAFGYSAALQALEADQRIDAARTAVMGHSRYGKAALLAAVWDRRTDAVIAHQSGFAGASLSRSKTGERLPRMARTYPHWVKAGFDASPEAVTALPVDQHQLLALAAPVPIFLGNGRKDVWSDPNSSFRAAQAASAAYAAKGGRGVAGGMLDFDPEADLAWWMRKGGHSIVAADIDAFLAFLNAHFQSGSAIAASAPNGDADGGRSETGQAPN